MPTDSITKDFVVKDYDAYVRLFKDIRKCKECDYSDICDIIEVPSDEACEAIRSCTKDFLYEKIWETLDRYSIKRSDNV